VQISFKASPAAAGDALKDICTDDSGSCETYAEVKSTVQTTATDCNAQNGFEVLLRDNMCSSGGESECEVESTCTVSDGRQRRLAEGALLLGLVTITAPLAELEEILDASVGREEVFVEELMEQGPFSAPVLTKALEVVLVVEVEEGVEAEDFMDIAAVQNAVADALPVGFASTVSVETMDADADAVAPEDKELIECCPEAYNCDAFDVRGECQDFQLCVPGPDTPPADYQIGAELQELVVGSRRPPQCSNPVCDNTCADARNGVCNDGRGEGAVTCELGGDCEDCSYLGTTYAYIISGAPSQRRLSWLSVGVLHIAALLMALELL